MAYTPHVNGPCLVRVGPSGVSGVVSDVGFTDGGPGINIEWHKEPVIADNAGPMLPADLQLMGKSAKLDIDLVVYDATVFQTAFLTDGTTEGLCDITGKLIFQNSLGFRVIFTSPIDGLVWRFPYCTIDAARSRIGSKYNIWHLGIDAIPYVANALSLNAAKLWDHTNA
jgi:hypothetical protein